MKPISLVFGGLFLLACSGTAKDNQLGTVEATRVYVEFADGKNRGMYDSQSAKGGFPDEEYDATTAMVINWHKLPEQDTVSNAILEYRQEYPEVTGWETAKGDSREFWFREELIHRCILKDLQPNSVYGIRFKEDGEVFRIHTMPADLEQREVKLVIASDLQSPGWNAYAHDNAKMVALLKPDMFLALGDFVNCEGRVTPENAARWATYLDYLYNADSGYYLIEKEIDSKLFSNIVIPHVAILGNHETGDQHHIRWPACIVAKNPGYSQYTAANWMELLFHFPFSSEGFLSEYHPGHPNINQEQARKGYGHGGFGKLSFSDYLLLIALDNNQNWEGEANKGLRDWKGNLITETWPWFDKNQSEVRQDLWLNNLLEPASAPPAGEIYDHIIPVWHRGLFGSARYNMSFKNRDILEYWLPVLYRNGVKFFAEAHDHLYGSSIPMGISSEPPANTYVKNVHYTPRFWTLSDTIPQSYKDEFFSVNCIMDKSTDEIIGWEHKGHYISYDPAGMRAFGYGGWAAGRRKIGDLGAGNAGWWFRDQDKGGKHIAGSQSFHINVVTLTKDGLVTEAIGTDQLEKLQQGAHPTPIHDLGWDKASNSWSDQQK